MEERRFKMNSTSKKNQRLLTPLLADEQEIIFITEDKLQKAVCH
jgi:hypothetical protein